MVVVFVCVCVCVCVWCVKRCTMCVSVCARTWWVGMGAALPSPLMLSTAPPPHEEDWMKIYRDEAARSVFHRGADFFEDPTTRLYERGNVCVCVCVCV